MKKRAKYFLFFLLLFIPVVIYCVIPSEYGDSYSEQQRKVWNTHIKDTNRSSRIDWNPKRKRLQHNKLEEKTATLANLYQPKWDAPLDITPDFDQLPMEGMTTWELAELGKKTNDPDIYLLLSEIRENTNLPRHDHQCSPIYYALCKKWLQKAIDLKRPGAEFLLAAANASAKQNTFEGENKNASYIMEIPGYDDFSKLVLEGDYRLFRALLSIEPYVFLTPLGNRFESQLKRQADSGNVEAQRKLGEIGFLFYQILTDYAECLITNEETAYQLNKQNSKFKLWLEEQEYVSFHAGITPTRNKMIQYARYLEEAAEAGDLQAMNLWMIEGSRYAVEYGKKQWNFFFKFRDILIQTGYADFIHELILQSGAWNIASGYFPYYYGKNEMERITPGYFRHLFQRNDKIQSYIRECEKFLSNGKPLPDEIALPMLEAWIEIRPFEINSFLALRYYENTRIITLLINILEVNATAGHIDSLIELGNLHMDGLYIGKDLSKALNYYERAWDIMKKQTDFNNLYGQDIFAYFFRFLPKLFEFYLGHGSDFFDRGKAIQLVHDFESYISYPRHHQYVLDAPAESDVQLGIDLFEGIKYDKGLGAPQDHNKAQQIYNRIFESEAWKDFATPLLKEIDSCYQEP